MMVSENDIRCDLHLQENFLCLHMLSYVKRYRYLNICSIGADDATA